MRPFSDSRTRIECPARSLGIPGRFVLLLALGTATLSGSATAQTGSWTAEPSSLCSRDNALEIIREQVDATKTFDDPAQRIAVLIRAADLLWPYRQDEARTTFT